jgi:N-acetylmuramoyl-L-alanine amidase
MPETRMARHCIGLNYDSIGIENLGGGPRWPLTGRQLDSNVALVRYLAGKYPIRYLLGHMEWKRFENSPLFRELDPTYRNAKADPGPVFMQRLRVRLKDLRLAGSAT